MPTARSVTILGLGCKTRFGDHFWYPCVWVSVGHFSLREITKSGSPDESGCLRAPAQHVLFSSAAIRATVDEMAASSSSSSLQLQPPDRVDLLIILSDSDTEDKMMSRESDQSPRKRHRTEGQGDSNEPLPDVGAHRGPEGVLTDLSDFSYKHILKKTIDKYIHNYM